jgi:hypothetical protein
MWKSNSAKRNYKSINLPTFSNDLASTLNMGYDFTAQSFSHSLDNFNRCLTTCLNEHAPLQKLKIRYKARPPWLDHEYVLERAKRRKHERDYKRSKSPVDKRKLVAQRSHCNELVKSKRQLYYKESIQSCNGDQKALFRVMKHLLDMDDPPDVFPVLLDDKSNIKDDLTLSTDFNHYFVSKISDIRHEMPQVSLPTSPEAFTSSETACHLTVFNPCTTSEVEMLLKSSGCLTSINDVLPSRLLNHSKRELFTYLTHLVNLSLSTGIIDDLKEAYIRPTLKNTSADCNILKSYRPTPIYPSSANLSKELC